MTDLERRSPEDWYCFLDTTVFWDSADSRKRLAELADEARTRLYVPETVTLERIHRRVRDAKTAHAALRRFENHVTLPPLPSDDELLASVRRETDAMIDALGARILPCVVSSEDIDTAAQACAQFGIRIGFRDMVILLSSIGFAKAQEIRACIVVSKNTAEFAEAIAHLGPLYGLRMLHIPTAEDLLQVLAVRPDNTARLIEYLNLDSQMNALLGLVASHPGLLFHLSRLFHTETDMGAVRSSTTSIRSVSAIPDAPPVEGNRCGMRLTVAADSVGRPGIAHVTFTLTGHALARYEKGRFAGELTVPEGLTLVSVSE